MGPLRGEYGFLTDFDSVSEAEARLRVREMVGLFGIREFQFYDAFEGYSHPPQGKETWRAACFGRRIRRRLLQVYADEIRRCGGRSWLYVQAMGADPGDLKLEANHTVAGQHTVLGRPLLDVVVPSEAWALRVAPAWAEFASSLGFTGIHWDTLGAFNSVVAESADFPGFLRGALPVLQRFGLAQTANFVDGAFWDGGLLGRKSGQGRIIAFPYWEVWTVPAVEQRFFDEVASRVGSVLALYPGRSSSHMDERQNSRFQSVAPLELMMERWALVRTYGGSYVGVGDGTRRIQAEYFPDTVQLTGADIVGLRRRVFGDRHFQLASLEDARARFMLPWQIVSLCGAPGVFPVANYTQWQALSEQPLRSPSPVDSPRDQGFQLLPLLGGLASAAAAAALSVRAAWRHDLGAQKGWAPLPLSDSPAELPAAAGADP